MSPGESWLIKVIRATFSFFGDVRKKSLVVEEWWRSVAQGHEQVGLFVAIAGVLPKAENVLHLVSCVVSRKTLQQINRPDLGQHSSTVPLPPYSPPAHH
jgi:hypothetical protein